MDDVRTIFDRHGLRHTTQREAIYRALASTKAHPTADELLAVVRRAQPELSLATVYNTLSTLERRGLCRKFSASPNAPARYDADTRQHVHLTTEDGRIRDLPLDLGEALLAALPADLLEDVETRLGVRIDGVRLELLGRAVDRTAC